MAACSVCPLWVREKLSACSAEMSKHASSAANAVTIGVNVPRSITKTHFPTSPWYFEMCFTLGVKGIGDHGDSQLEQKSWPMNNQHRVNVRARNLNLKKGTSERERFRFLSTFLAFLYSTLVLGRRCRGITQQQGSSHPGEGLQMTRLDICHAVTECAVGRIWLLAYYSMCVCVCVNCII